MIKIPFRHGSSVVLSATTVEDNIQRVRMLPAGSQQHLSVQAVLKTDAYQTNLAKAFRSIYEHVDAVCVASIEEAITLDNIRTAYKGRQRVPVINLGDMTAIRHSLSETERLQLSPNIRVVVRSDQDLTDLIEWNRQLAEIPQFPPIQRVENYIGIDVGMERGDADLDTAVRLARTAHELGLQKPGYYLVSGVMGHLTSAGMRGNQVERDRRVEEETNRFDYACDQIRKVTEFPHNASYSLTATDGTLLCGGADYPRSRYANTVRIGKGLYGVETSPDGTEQNLRTAAAVVGTIHGTHWAKESHGYNRIAVDSPVRLARIAIMGPTHQMKGSRLRIVRRGQPLFPDDYRNHEHVEVFNQDQNTLYLNVTNTGVQEGDWAVVVEPSHRHENSWENLARRFQGRSGTQLLMDLSRAVSRTWWAPCDLKELLCS